MQETSQHLEHNIAWRLAQQLKAHKLNCNELAKRTGLTQPTVYRLLHAQTSNPRLAVVKKLADFFGVDIDYFVASNPQQTFSVPLVQLAQLDSAGLVDNHGYEPVRLHGSVNVGSFAIPTTQCMQTMFCPGTLLIFDPKIEAEDGDIVCCYDKQENSAVIRIITLDGPRILLQDFDGQQVLNTEGTTILATLVKTVFDVKDSPKLRLVTNDAKS